MERLVYNLMDPKFSTTVEELDDIIVAACGCRQLTLVKFLIEHNILQTCKRTAQAFGAAVRNGCEEMVQTLLESGVEVDMRLDDAGTTALMAASEKGHANLVGLLLHRAAEVPRLCIALHSAGYRSRACRYCADAS